MLIDVSFDLLYSAASRIVHLFALHKILSFCDCLFPCHSINVHTLLSIHVCSMGFTHDWMTPIAWLARPLVELMATHFPGQNSVCVVMQLCGDFICFVWPKPIFGYLGGGIGQRIKSATMGENILMFKWNLVRFQTPVRLVCIHRTNVSNKSRRRTESSSLWNFGALQFVWICMGRLCQDPNNYVG